MPDEFKYLNKEDLFLLMESYRNMIQMHTTLAEQQKSIIDLQNKIISKEDEIYSKQGKTIDHLEKVSKSLEDCSNKLIRTNDTIHDSCSSLERTLSSNINSVGNRVGDNHLESTKQHSGINSRLYISMGAMAAIIISLVSLAIGLVEKYDILVSIQHTVAAILQKLG